MVYLRDMKQRNPEEQIQLKNPWYTGDQVDIQLGSKGTRRVIEERWNIFHSMIREWLAGMPENERKKLRLLDAGCGDGVNLIGLHDILTGQLDFQYVGMDYSPLRVKRASSRDYHVLLSQADLRRIPFKDDSFDVVLCNQVLEHIPDTSLVLQEMNRVLKHKGLLITGIPNEGCLMGRLRNHYIQPSISRKTDHVRFFTESEFKKELNKAGFIIHAIKHETFFFPCTHMNTVAGTFSAGYKLMALLRTIFPSQAGGVIISSTK